MTRNSRRLQKAVQAIFNDYREKASCSGQVYQNAACGCENSLQMWRGPKGDKGDQGPQGPKGDNAGSFLVNAEFVVDPEGQEPGAYLKLVLIDVAQQEQVVYVDLSYLTDIYTGGNGISITDMVVAARLGAGLTFDANGNIASAYQFCDGLDETSNVVKVRLDSSNHILGFASGTCGGLTASVGLAPSATGTNLVLTGADGTVLSTVPLNGSDGITVQKNAQTGGFTWLADPAGLVSSQSGNQLSVSQTDNKLYAGGNTLSYTFGTGAFTLKDSSGATLSSVTVPSAVRMLEDMELRTDDGVYLHLTYLRDNGLRAYQDVSLDGLLCHNIDTADDTAAAYSKAVPSGNWQTATINEIGGRTVVWNQIAKFTKNGSESGSSGLTYTWDNAAGTLTISGTNVLSMNINQYFYAEGSTTISHYDIGVKNHVWFLCGAPVGSSSGEYFIADDFNGNVLDTGNGVIYKNNNQNGVYALIRIRPGATLNNVVFRPQQFDLTQMFGADIAEEIYNLEQATPGAGKARFRQMFPAAYYAYNPGTLLSAGVTEVVSKDANDATIATLPIPSALLALPGYGWSVGTVYNYVDFERKVYVQNVAMATFDGSADEGWALTSPASTTRQAFLSSGYLQSTKAYLQIINDKGILVNISSQDSPAEANIITMRSTNYEATYLYIFVPPSILSGIDAFKAWLAANPITITYALATPVETDISSLLTDSTIEVEPGGSLTFRNQHGDNFRLPVPNSETFIYEHPWVFEDCIKELVSKEFEPYSSSIADVSASFECRTVAQPIAPAFNIGVCDYWDDGESDGCYSSDYLNDTLDFSMLSGVETKLGTLSLANNTPDNPVVSFGMGDAINSQTPLTLARRELLVSGDASSLYGSGASNISVSSLAVGDSLAFTFYNISVTEYNGTYYTGRTIALDAPTQTVELSSEVLGTFTISARVVREPDVDGKFTVSFYATATLADASTSTMPTLTLTTTDVSGTTHEQEIDMSCILDTIDDKFGDLSPVAMSGSFNDLTDTPTNHVTTDTNQTITGVKTFGAGVYGNVVAMSAGAIDVSAGTVFTKTIAANTTISFSNVPAAPATACVTLILTNGGSKTVTWPSSVKWSGGTAPNLTASGVDVLTFLTVNGGTTWYGTVNSLGAA